MWELDCEESWVPNNWCFWTVVLEKTLESPLDCKEIQLVHPKGDQSWMFFGRTDAEVETPVLWPPHAKSWLIGKDSDAGRDWGQEEKGTTGWDGLMASPTWWMWVWVNSGSWWWTGRPGVLQFMGSQRVGHDWATELIDWCNACVNRRSNINILWGLNVSYIQAFDTWWSHCVCMCVCVWERERERERNSLLRKEVAQTDGLKLAWYPFLAHFTNLDHSFQHCCQPAATHLHLCFVHIPYLSSI